MPSPAQRFCRFLHFTPIYDNRYDGALWRSTVEVDVTIVTSTDVQVDRIRAKDYGKGYGTRALRQLIRAADKYRVALFLKAAPTGGYYENNLKDLKRFYRRFGFRSVGGDCLERKPKR